jgi:hypothetical protein
MSYPVMPHFRIGRFGSPVQVMNEFLTERRGTDPQIFAKIDSDTMVPPGWLDECLAVMSDEPQLDFLGIEAFNPVVEKHEGHRSYTQARFIGGIGLMRPAAFTSLPWPNGRFGFTEWQEATRSRKGLDCAVLAGLSSRPLTAGTLDDLFEAIHRERLAAAVGSISRGKQRPLVMVD